MNLQCVNVIIGFVGLFKEYLPLHVGFIFFILILLILYVNATILSRRWLARIIIVSLGMFFFSCIFILIKFRPPAHKPRLAVLPFSYQEGSIQSNWPARAIPQLITDILQTASKQEYYVSSFASLKGVIPTDSLRSFDYISSIAQRADLDFTITGEVLRQDNAWRIHWYLRDEVNETLFDSTAVYLESELLLAVDDISRIGMKQLHFPVNALQPHHSLNPILLQKIILSEILLDEKEYEAAKGELEDESSSLALGQIAKVLLEQSKYQRYMGYPSQEYRQLGYEIAQEALAADSTILIPYLLLAEFEILGENWDDAEQLLRRAITINPIIPETLLMLARLHPSRYADMGFRNSKSLLSAIILYDPCNIDARIALANVYHSEGEITKALNLLDEILEIHPSSVKGLMAKSRIYIAQSDVTKILEVSEKIFDIDPNFVEAYYNLGIYYYHAEDFGRARDLFEKECSQGLVRTIAK